MSRGPYDWVKVQMLAKADNHCQRHIGQFGKRIEFLNGVRWMLEYIDRNELLGVLGESLISPLPRGENGSQGRTGAKK